ncbi:MAG: ABC transporter ATP-binding protein [Deltaproteobacteria bacterium]|nr:ABC transporter ATP-binding protein [Deltaproteobacteria bacterium]
MIEVDGLTHKFDKDGEAVLEDISFSLNAGDSLAVIGPSGCGKTTLLAIMAGLIPATAGRVTIQGNRSRSGKTSIILQDYGLFPWKTLAENMALGMKIQNMPAEVRTARTKQLLSELNLTPYAHRYPVQLSGGQKQRVAIARAIATEPDVLLMDEPFSSLDALTREHLQAVVKDMWRKNRLTFAIVTHSVEEAVFLGRFIMVLGSRPARIRAMMDNPLLDMENYRLSDTYFNKIKEVRKVLES